MITKESVKYGKATIDFSVKYRDRKSMSISVLPDMGVEVVAPAETSINLIKKKIEKRASWILKQKRHFSAFFPKQPPRKYVSGETHMYMGRQYRLRIVKAKENYAKMKVPYIYIYTTNKDDAEQNKKILYSWYLEKANKRFVEIQTKLLDKLKKYEVSEPKMVIQQMKVRWGSCIFAKNKIVLNLELIKAPRYCIEYIMMHELCHLKYPNHNKRFYNFLSLIMPDWQERKTKLEKAFL